MDLHNLARWAVMLGQKAPVNGPNADGGCTADQLSAAPGSPARTQCDTYQRAYSDYTTAADQRLMLVGVGLLAYFTFLRRKA